MVRRLSLATLVVALLMALLTSAPVAAELDTDHGWDHRPADIGGQYQVVTGQFGGDLATDILFYAPGAAPDALWIGTKDGRGEEGFLKVSLAIGGNYVLVVGDFGGDDYDDILFYGPGSAPDSLWLSDDRPGYFDKSRKVSAGGNYQPKVLHDYRAAGAKDDILFLAPGPAKDYYWHFTEWPGYSEFIGPASYRSRELKVNGAYQLLIGDYSGDKIEDVLLYQPGTAPDYQWKSDADGNFRQTNLRINGNYLPAVIYGSARDGLLWWGDGARADYYWVSTGSSFVNRPIPQQTSTGTVTSFGLGGALIVVPGQGDLLFYGDNAAGGFFPLADPASHDQNTAAPYVGDFDDNGLLDVLWYGPGTDLDEIWYGITAVRSRAASTLAGAATPAGQRAPVASR